MSLHPEQPPPLGQQQPELLKGRVRSSREARHLIRTLRLRLAKAGGGNFWLRASWRRKRSDALSRERCKAGPVGPQSKNYALRA